MRARLALAAVLCAGLPALADEPAAPEKVIQVTAKKFEFSPSVIELKVGVPVVLELRSLDREHGFSVPGLHIDETIPKGGVTRVRVVPREAGSFDLHCSVFCGSGHEEMTGRIVVSP